MFKADKGVGGVGKLRIDFYLLRVTSLMLKGTVMSVFLQCPLCGKLSKLDSYDPSTFDNDIYVKRVRGLGRGAGFKWSPPKSVLGDKVVTPLIADRTLNILAMLVKAKSVNTTDVFKRLGVKDVVASTDLGKEGLTLRESLGKLQAGFEERGVIIQDLGEELINLKEENVRLKATVEHKDDLLEESGEEILSLKEKLEHRTEQAKKLYRICKSQKRKINEQQDLLAELGNELLGG